MVHVTCVHEVYMQEGGKKYTNVPSDLLVLTLHQLWFNSWRDWQLAHKTNSPVLKPINTPEESLHALIRSCWELDSPPPMIPPVLG